MAIVRTNISNETIKYVDHHPEQKIQIIVLLKHPIAFSDICLEIERVIDDVARTP
jgi:hypothetical protein